MEENALVNLFKIRNDFISGILNIGINPFSGDSLYTALMKDETPEVIFDIVKRIKLCYYMAYVNNIALYNYETKSYFTNFGLEIPVKSIVNKLGPIVLQNPPNCIVY